ncbi:helix-turn-helix domain-containing protein [Orbaceae bacterium ESL0727]|nr:helix-turn-helix domain-containing protein [Orbaceae bacterium ESL0727]
MQDIRKPLRSSSYSISCELCSLGPICTPILLNDALLERKKAFPKDHVFVTKDTPCTHFYIVNTGALKTYVTDQDGNEQINGFYLPGDVIGLDSIYTKKYNNNLKALTDTLVCELHYDEFIALMDTNKQVRDLVFNLLSRDICNYQKLILFFSQKKADSRLAIFIYSLYSRYEQHGHSSLNIKLSMSRADIANYLGLTIETVSRIFSKFQELGILSVQGKYIFIKDLDALIKLGN